MVRLGTHRLGARYLPMSETGQSEPSDERPLLGPSIAKLTVGFPPFAVLSQLSGETEVFRVRARTVLSCPLSDRAPPRKSFSITLAASV